MNNNTPKSKEYEIKSFEQLINVANDENIERLATDLALWLLHAAGHYKLIRKAHPEETKDKTNWEIGECAFMWIDDGKNEYLGTQLTDKATGQITKINSIKNDAPLTC